MKNEYLYWDNQNDIERLVQSLRNGEVSIGTSDTVVGLMAPLSKAGFDRLNEIKSRLKKPYIILFSSADLIEKVIAEPLDKNIQRLIDSCWPGPLTLVFNAKKTVPAWMKSKEGTIAIRVPDHQGLQAVSLLLGGIFSTSANTQNIPAPTTIEDVEPEIIQKAAFIVTNRKGREKMTSSTILDCSGPKLKVLREGVYSIADLEQLYGKRIL